MDLVCSLVHTPGMHALLRDAVLMYAILLTCSCDAFLLICSCEPLLFTQQQELTSTTQQDGIVTACQRNLWLPHHHHMVWCVVTWIRGRL